MQNALKFTVALTLLGGFTSVFSAIPQAGMWSVDGEVNGKPGRGIHLERQETNKIILSYFGYRTDGSATFYQAVGDVGEDGTFAADLIEYKNGTALGQSFQSGETNKNLGKVNIKFNTSSSGIISLPGDTSKSIGLFTYQDLTHRLKLTYATTYISDFWGANIPPQGQIKFTVKNDAVHITEILNYGLSVHPTTSCEYSGTINQNGSTFSSKGTMECNPKSNHEFKFYQLDDLKISDSGIISGHMQWIDGTGFNKNASRFLMGTCMQKDEDVIVRTERCLPSDLK